MWNHVSVMGEMFPEKKTVSSHVEIFIANWKGKHFVSHTKRNSMTKRQKHQASKGAGGHNWFMIFVRHASFIEIITVLSKMSISIKWIKSVLIGGHYFDFYMMFVRKSRHQKTSFLWWWIKFYLYLWKLNGPCWMSRKTNCCLYVPFRTFLVTCIFGDPKWCGGRESIHAHAQPQKYI
jgi:hypothetical protein